MSVLRGYVNQRDGLASIPHSVQNAVLRDYCSRHSHDYRLAATEVARPGRWTALDGVVAEIEAPSDIEGVVAYGLDAFPPDAAQSDGILTRIVDSGGEIHFALEGLRLTEHAQIDSLRDVLELRRFVDGLRWSPR